MADSHVWMAEVTPEVRALSTEDAKALVDGSTFALRMETTDPEHRSRMCHHGRLVFQVCNFCEAGIPPMPDPTVIRRKS